MLLFYVEMEPLPLFFTTKKKKKKGLHNTIRNDIKTNSSDVIYYSKTGFLTNSRNNYLSKTGLAGHA